MIKAWAEHVRKVVYECLRESTTAIVFFQFLNRTVFPERKGIAANVLSQLSPYVAHRVRQFVVNDQHIKVPVAYHKV